MPLITLTLALGLGGLGCATMATPNKTEDAAAVQRLRAENIANQRKLEELENQVFVLNSALENRRRAEPPASAPSLPPSLPEIKLTRGERVPQPSVDNSPASTPASLVDETEVEYAGAAAEGGSTKRPVLRIWGAGAGETGSSEEIVSPVASARARDKQESDARRDAKDRQRGGRRLALARPAGEVSPPSAASSIMADSANGAGDDQDPGGSKPASRPSEEIERTTKAETKRESARGRADHGKTHRAGEPASTPANKALAKAAAKPEPAPPAPVVEETPPPAPVKLHPMTAPAKAKPVASGPKGSGTDLYNSALADLREGRHADAVAGLRTFVRLHAQHDLADNAQYWLGECYYDRKDYAAAAREFGKVGNEFPTGNKVPDAQLKLGLSQLALGNVRAARTALSDVVRRYPQHPAASLAGAKLAAIGGADASAALSRRPDSKEVR